MSRRIKPITARLWPRWIDVGVFAASGATVVLICLLAGKVDAAGWIGLRILGLACLLAVVTVYRQHKH